VKKLSQGRDVALLIKIFFQVFVSCDSTRQSQTATNFQKIQTKKWISNSQNQTYHQSSIKFSKGGFEEVEPTPNKRKL
jgi:hypothetical protein